MASIHLKPGREKSILRRHPWIYSGALASVTGEPAPGATVEVRDSSGSTLGFAAFSPHSQIRARLWTFDPSEQVDRAFFERRLAVAIGSRADMFTLGTNAIRLVHAESDGLPGIVVDRYAEVLVVQFLTAGAEYWKETIADLLLEQTACYCIYERCDADVRLLEGLPLRNSLLRGTLPASPLHILENDLQFFVDIQTGHKTGFYLDQRLNRLQLRSLARGRHVLDAFCYTGGFTVNALAGEAASVLSLDASAVALAACSQNINLNKLPADRHTCLEGDVFHLLRKFRDEGRSFDLIVLDPPKFAPTAAQARKAARGYKDINLLAFKLLNPAGLLVTFSCSGGVDVPLFQKIVASAALDAGVDAHIIAHLSQAPDHPVALSFPEGAYLKGLICRRL